jgi:signal transduction histidine kinase/DNA-binding response OmpR family regulator
MPRRGYMPVLLSDSAAGVTARRLVIAAILAPPFFSFLEYLGVQHQLFASDFGILLRAVGSVSFFVVVILKSTEKLHQSLRDQRRQQNRLAQQELAMAHALAAQKEAIQATQVKSDFLNSMSHEIRTPLNGIIGMLTLLGNTELNSLQKSLLHTMDASSHVLLNLVNQILDLSKIEAGKIELSENNFELRGLVESTIAIVDLPAREKQLTLASQIHTQAHGYYLGDSFRVQQIILNLLHNVIKFSDRGIITLKIEKVSDVGDESTLRFEIIDSGIGLDEAGVQKLFKAFSQVKTAHDSNHSGTGLGLAISKKLVELMHGKIGVESKKGIGSKFFFEIKLKNSKVVNTPELAVTQSNAKLADRIKGHVLVAEDNKVNQKVACHLLEILGCTVRTVETGVEVIEALRIEHFDIILMDGQMPAMDGYEATRRIRKGEAGPENSKIPIMAVTANVVQGNMQNCYDAGMNDFIGKPIDFDDFACKVKKWISWGRGVIDKKAIDRLQQLAGAGNENLIKDLVSLFKQETVPALKAIRLHVEHGDYISAAKTAHHLKSSCANLGAYKMQELTEKIEKSKMTVNKDEMLELVYALEQEYEIASSELQKLVAF